MASPDDTFAAIAARWRGAAGVAEGTGFGGKPGLRVGGKIFAFLRDGELVVKLPAARCAQLVADGAAVPFDAGKGRPMREWVVFAARDLDDWAGAAEEAHAFVSRSASGASPS
jgi:hypothetical protein